MGVTHSGRAGQRDPGFTVQPPRTTPEPMSSCLNSSGREMERVEGGGKARERARGGGGGNLKGRKEVKESLKTAFYRWSFLKQFVMSVLPPHTCMVLRSPIGSGS
jgi:hypothetical protein